MRIGAVPWQCRCYESDFDFILVQIENNYSLSKVYITSLLNACIRGQKLETHQTTIAQSREENSRH